MLSVPILLVFACCATAHFVAACALFVYGLRRVNYIALAWVNTIFFFALLAASFFSGGIAAGHPGLLHPVMLLVLMAVCYLQSIYPISIPMPGFLQSWRMLKYAAPALIVIAIYLIFLAFGGDLVNIFTFRDLLTHSLSSDMLLRFIALGLGIYYIVNIIKLPRRLSRGVSIPSYLLGYCSMLGILFIYFTAVTIFYTPLLLMIYIVLFTILNLYLVFCVLDIIAVHLPKPPIVEVREEPEVTIAKNSEDDDEDFNEANLQRFRRMEFWMQNHRDDWTDSSFGRDKLCTELGYNRHLVLQSLRSQGYNNVHDYITRYRIEELKRLIQNGDVQSVSDALSVGFGTAVTARSCFERMEGTSLDAYLAGFSK